MKKMKKGSKGFTLTELAIVIAVIAILIAVLVPTFVSLIDKANKTSDNILVSNVNEVLAVDETTNGTPATIDDALAAAEAAGYNVSNLSTSSSGTLIVWNETSNEFVYVNSELDSSGNFTEVDGEAVTTDTSSNLWVITSSYNSTYEAYSQYISGTVEAGTTLEVKAGVSVGDNENVNITYTNDDGKEKTVTFVTNGGTLTVNDASATVNQYGAVSKVVVTAVDAANSFHANGEVEGNIEIKEGHLVMESGASVVDIEVDKDADNVSIATKENSTAVSVLDYSGKATLTVESGTNLGIAAGFSDENVTGTNSITLDEYNTYKARVGLSFYEYFADAVTEAKASEETVTLLNDVSLTTSGNVSAELYISSGSLTLDLNGNTISGGSIVYPIYIGTGSSLTINDSKGSGVIEIAGTYGVYALGTLNINGGTIKSSASGAAVLVYNGTINTTGGSIIASGQIALWLYQAQSANLENLTINTSYTSWGYCIYCSSCTGAISMTNVTIDAGAYCCGVALLTYSSATMTDCNITSNGWYCVANNGADSAVSLIINGGTYTATDCTALYLPNFNATTTINNANITGATGIEIRGGYLTLTNCTVAGTNSSYVYQSNGSGNTVYGSAIAISQHTTKKTIQVTINGGTYTAKAAPAITQNNLNGASDDDLAKITLTISSAKISGNSEYGNIYLENKDKINYTNK